MNTTKIDAQNDIATATKEIQDEQQKVKKVVNVSKLVGIAGAITFAAGSIASVAPVTLVGVSVWLSSMLAREVFAEHLNKNVVKKQKDIVRKLGTTKDVEIMEAAEKAQAMRPKVRAAMFGSYMLVGCGIASTPGLLSSPSTGAWIASFAVGLFAGLFASKTIEKTTQKKVRFYDEPTFVANNVLKNVLENRENREYVGANEATAKRRPK